ncbi:MAG: hypothetical protein ACRDRN_14315 [Sciscionella sp.]
MSYDEYRTFEVCRRDAAARSRPVSELVASNLELSLSLETKSNITEDHREGINALREKRSVTLTCR